MSKNFAAAVLALLIAAVTATAAGAESLTFNVQSEYPYAVQLEFYSQNRDHAWPGGTEAYELLDSEVHEYTLACDWAEKICYGAWVRGDSTQYWGVGAHDEFGCDRCCAVCDGSQTSVYVLDY